MYIKVDKTPNDNVLMFSTNNSLGVSGEFCKGFVDEEKNNGLVSMVLKVDGVASVFVCDNFISVTKDTDFSWGEIKPLVLSCLVDFLDQVDKSEHSLVDGGLSSGYVPINDLEREILQAIDRRVRPAMKSHGGDVEFLGVTDDFVMIRLVGACVGCVSSGVTLKDGLERVIKQFFPSIKGVKEA